MAQATLPNCVEVLVPAPASRLISDSELAALPPAPRRSADLVARRATARRPVGTVAPVRAYRVWPFLATACVVGSYLAAAGVTR